MNAPLQTLLDPYFSRLEAHFWIEGLLALTIALFAIALRRQKRMFKPQGFIMLSIGLILDLMTPRAEPVRSLTVYWRAVALILVLFGVIRLVVETCVVAARGRKADLSTMVAEVILAALYGVTALVIFRFMLGISPRVLIAIPAVGTLTAGWILQGNFFAGILLQYRHPFVPGDWVRLGNHVGRVQGSGWRATRLITRANEIVQIPNTLLAKELLVNYSSGQPLADEIFVGLGYETPPEQAERTIHTLVNDIPEIVRSEVDVWEFGESAIRYRIRFWIADYSVQEQVRIRINRSLWYALQRSAIEIPFPTRKILAQAEHAPETAGQGADRATIRELRRVYLLDALTDEELGVLIPTIRVRRFGRGEVLIRQGETGDSFYVLRRGKVEVTAKGHDGVREKRIGHIEDSSPESFFGEIALLTGEPRNATIRAASDVEVWEIAHEAFARLFKSKPDAGATIAEVAARRFAETSERTAQPQSHAAVAHRSAKGVLATMRKVFDF